MIAPTLLVGLGGTGSKIVCRVSQMVTEEQRKRIGFAVFDTDINELREIREANPFIRRSRLNKADGRRVSEY
mgnify:CR=1 FL=1